VAAAEATSLRNIASADKLRLTFLVPGSFNFFRRSLSHLQFADLHPLDLVVGLSLEDVEGVEPEVTGLGIGGANEKRKLVAGGGGFDILGF
jgi:hypothetical protein